MHLVAIAAPRVHGWRWRILTAEGQEIASSSVTYSSLSAALDAGRTRYQHLVRRHPPLPPRPRDVRRRRPKP
jgi:hypothetical protein